jgi:hypothetical protein
VVNALARLPSQPGPNRLEGLDAGGARVFSLSFGGDLVQDLPSGDEYHFAYVVPLTPTEQGRLASLRLTGQGLTAVRVPPAALRAGASQAPGARLRAAAVRGARVGQDLVLQWDPAYPMAVVRDARTGEILSFARGGSARVGAGPAGVTVELTDGVSNRLPLVTIVAP